MTRFSDIDLNFTRNPITNDVSIKYDDEAIKSAVKNLVLTEAGERPFQPTLGCGIRSLLFEPATPIVATELEARIRNVLRSFEPRVSIIRIVVKINNDNNSFDVTVAFRVKGDSRPILVPITLKRLR